MDLIDGFDLPMLKQGGHRQLAVLGRSRRHAWRSAALLPLDDFMFEPTFSSAAVIQFDGLGELAEPDEFVDLAALKAHPRWEFAQSDDAVEGCFDVHVDSRPFVYIKGGRWE